ncbi:Detected protein of unknown function [Hibiscus syriacus]|uniref:Uncharacterized protein n=2 Tax=Hibiscus syriacus TaxID=106335 RepID=A0A6A3B1U6_HIBSY|nr:Detected protein of unknown function [Hibiscus syriacus]
MKHGKQRESEEIEFQQTQKKELVKSSSSLGIPRTCSSVLGPPVPEFSATSRKENRKQPGKKWSKGNDVSLWNWKGTKSGEKKGRLMMITRKSIEELKRDSSSAANAINGENRGGKNTGNR